MKKVLFVLTLISVLILASCGKKTSGEVPSIIQDNLPNWGITLTVEDITSTGLTLVVTQSGGEPDGELQTGSPYHLDKLVGDKWEAVEEAPLPEGVDARGWNAMAYIVPMGTSTDYEINWEWLYGELSAGTYRLVKSFDLCEYGEYESFSYWVAFAID